LTDWRGDLVSQVVVLRDVTKRKRADAALAEQRQHLERLVQQRTAELTVVNEQLRQEAAERERAEKRMRRFLNRQIIVNQLTLALGEARSLDRIYHTIYEHVRRLMDASAFIVSSYDGEQGVIRAEYVVTDGTAHDIARFSPIPLEEAGFGTQSRVIRTGEPFYAPNWREVMAKTRTEYTVDGKGTVSEGPPPPDRQEGATNSALFVAMRVEGETIGVIQVQSYRLDAYASEDIDLLSAMANVAAIAVQNARLYVEARRTAQQMQALYETSRALSSYFEEEPLMRTILETVYRTLGCEYVIVSAVDQDAQTIEVLHGIWRGEFDRFIYDGRDVFPEWKRMSRYPLDYSDITADIYRTGRTEVIGAWDERLNREIWEKFGHEKLLRVFMPIKVQDRVIGVVEVGYDKQRKGNIGKREVQVLAAFMDQAAVAIENVRLLEKEREQRELAEALEVAAAAVNSTLDLDQVLDRILEQVTRVVPGDACNVMLVEGYSAARVVRWRGYERLGMEDVIGDLTVSLVDVPNLVKMVRTGEPVVVLDTATASDWVQIQGEDALRSHVGAPIRVGGLTVGFLNVDGGQPGQFSPVDARKLQAFADHAATAIANAYLYAEQRRRVEEASILLEIASAVNSTLELERVLKEVALRAARACQANRCTILLLDGEEQTLHPIMSQFASGEPGPEMWHIFKEASYHRRVEEMPEILQVIRDRRPLFIPDVQRSSIPPQWSGSFDARSVLLVPLVSRERMVGLMALDRPEVGRAFTREQVDLAMTIGAQAATAIENAGLHRELQDYARQLEERVQERTAQLQVQYAQLEAILYSSSDGIIVVDSAGEILQTNPIADAWLMQALSEQDAVYLREAARDLARQVRADSASGNWPETILEFEGLDLELRAAPILGTEEENAAVVVAVHDITHLRELDRIKSLFITNVSHELRTPIATIKLYTMLMRQASPEKLAEYLDTMSQETDRLTRLVENVLQISRIDAGRLEMELQTVSLNELTAAVVENHRALARERGLDLEYRPADPGPVAPVDPTRIMQVLTDLVVNAIQYTPEGGRVTVSTGQVEIDERAWATVAVADTGIGIPERELAHMFERFFRGELPQRMQISGTGLGLAIAKAIVELHGGQMTVDSRVDVGSTFTVRLPLDESTD
jgi:signal transduction histidine kinase